MKFLPKSTQHNTCHESKVRNRSDMGNDHKFSKKRIYSAFPLNPLKQILKNSGVINIS